MNKMLFTTEKNVLSQQDDSVTCCTAWQPEFYHWDLCKGGKRTWLHILVLSPHANHGKCVYTYHAHTPIIIIKLKVSITVHMAGLKMYFILFWI